MIGPAPAERLQPLGLASTKVKIRLNAVHLKFRSYRRISAWCPFQHQVPASLVGAMD